MDKRCDTFRLLTPSNRFNLLVMADRFTTMLACVAIIADATLQSQFNSALLRWEDRSDVVRIFSGSCFGSIRPRPRAVSRDVLAIVSLAAISRLAWAHQSQYSLHP